MPTFDYDLFVIGAGSGGVRASRMSASYGARVAVAEAHRAGGTCVIRGCVPKKLLVYAAQYHEAFSEAGGFGWDSTSPSFSWRRLIEAKDAEVTRLEQVYQRLLEAAGVRLIPGLARLVDRHTVEVDGRRFTARFILIATGSWPRKPDIPGRDLAITSNEALGLAELPRHVLIIGGGYIAVEFASIFHALGAKVTLLHRGAEILRGFDADIARHLREALVAKGIEVVLQEEIAAITRHPQGLLASMKNSGGSVACDTVMFATGRVPQTASLAPEAAGVALDPTGAVLVDAYARSSVDNIFAVGDVTNRVQLTPVAIREGAAVAATLFNNRPTRIDHHNVPSAVFSLPPIGTVGDSEARAIARYGQVEVYQSRFRPLKAALSRSEDMVYIKLIVDPASNRVVGAHMVGSDAPEIIQGMGIAVAAGLTKQHFDDTVGIHPTVAEEFVTLKVKEVRKAP
jgi:glutathione reductase (NADPH)